ncbi:unnamed protein product [Lactuca saligna]|uniref:HECT domain-containing protein n=1 Tax=Lactuca saligna TaxID=75948 RepID=A0AA35UT44_LACSI|nr:unnamed protein product [Lactuca saligna]
MERCSWPKFGDVVQEDVGAKLTRVSTKEIIFERPRAPDMQIVNAKFCLLHTKVEDSNAIGDPLAQMSKGGDVLMADTLVEHIKFDHGYTSKSPVVINLLEIMGEFNPEQQREFCQFLTGAPRLPPGGLAVLNPKLNIVRKFYLVSNIAVKEIIAVATNREGKL